MANVSGRAQSMVMWCVYLYGVLFCSPVAASFRGDSLFLRMGKGG
jgi:hypothetical protein